jgi:hypothetical protein
MIPQQMGILAVEAEMNAKDNFDPQLDVLVQEMIYKCLAWRCIHLQSCLIPKLVLNGVFDN